MPLIDWIKNALGEADVPRHNNIASTLEFQQLDVAGIAKRMELESRAKERGQNNEPAAGTTGFDAVETAIISVIEAERDLALNAYLHFRTVMMDRLSGYSFATRITEISSASAAAIADFQKALQNGANYLFQEKRKLLDEHKEMSAFRARHHLERPAYYPSSRILRWAFVFLLFALEAIMNGAFLAEGDATYLVGGFGKALGIAFINVAFSFSLGWKLLPGIFHRNWAIKIFSLSLSAVLISALFGFNLAVAHFRTASANPDLANAAQIALQTMISAPFDLGDFVGWILFLVGFLFSLSAMADGFSMDDRYPGYGYRARRLDQIEYDYADEKEERLRELEEIKEAAQSKIKEAGEDIRSWQGQYRNLPERIQRLRMSLSSHMMHVEQVANTLLQTYRDENRQARSDSAPGHFSERWTIRPLDLGQDDSTLNALIADAEKALASVGSDITRHTQEMLDKYVEAVQAYRRIDDMVEPTDFLKTRTYGQENIPAPQTV